MVRLGISSCLLDLKLTGAALSPLGTNLAKDLPSFLTNNPLPQGYPWGTRTANNTNYYVDYPNTGVTRSYDWTVSKQDVAPDGVTVPGLLVNGQYPGPLIEANWGDWIEVTVHNNISDEGTAIHWHGILQKGSQWMDGVPGMDQCPIAPGSSFTYRFQAELYGSSWWHGHYSAQYGSGMIGPMVIYGPTNVDYDIDLGPVMINDWYHEYYFQGIEELMAPIPHSSVPRSDNNLINGKNDFDCSQTDLPCVSNAGLASFNFTSGKTHRLRIINPSAAAVEKFSIDGHTMTVIANDFVPIEPYETDVVTLGVGQRTDVIVKAKGSPTDSVWMRAFKPSNCAPSNGGDSAQAIIFYEDADRSQQPSSQAQSGWDNTYCGNDPLFETVPYYPIAPGEAATTEVIPIELKSNGTHLLWYMQDRTMRIDYNNPTLLEAKLGNLSFPYIENVHNYGTNSSVRFIVENFGDEPHPMHLHGHNMFILAEGSCSSSSAGVNLTGAVNSTRKRDLSIDYQDSTMHRRDANDTASCWDGTITNPNNPQRRDVQMLLPGNYIVVQWNQDNPGTWPFHCHIAWHLSSGFVWNILEQPEAIQNDMQIPSIMAQTCRDWAAYTGDHVVDQIDDGL